MTKIIMIAVLAILSSHAAMAGPKGDAHKACLEDYRAVKAKANYVKPEKGKGREAYQSFMKQCKASKT